MSCPNRRAPGPPEPWGQMSISDRADRHESLPLMMSGVRVLTVNAGSSSLKLRLLDENDDTVEDRELEAPASQIDADEVREALDAGLGEADAVGHRIVHGGERFR